MKLTEDELGALKIARYTAPPNTLEDDPQQEAIESAVEAILAARHARVETLAVDLRMESWHTANVAAADALRDAADRIIAALAPAPSGTTGGGA